MPQLNGILESAVYVDDLARSKAFYEQVMGLTPLMGDDRFCAYDVAGRQVFLLFVKKATLEPVETNGGLIPPHDADGRIHFAFAIAESELEAWKRQLAANNVAIESDAVWRQGGHSLYFRDPDGHLLELATPGLWPIY